MGAPFPAGLVFAINALPACQTVAVGLDRLCHDAQAKSRAVRRYYQEAPADLLFCLSDISIQAKALGARLAYAPDSLPVVTAPALVARSVRASQVERMRVNAQVLSDLGRDFPGRLRAAMVYGPFTVAGQVAGEQELLRSTLERPAWVHALLAQTLALALDYARLLLETGAEVLWVSDPLAALLPPRTFEEFAGQYLARLLEAHQGPTALHICGDTSRIIDSMLATGAGGISFDQCLDLLALEDAIPPEVAIIGNLDPVEVLELASPGRWRPRPTNWRGSWASCPTIASAVAARRRPPPPWPIWPASWRLAAPVCVKWRLTPRACAPWPPRCTPVGAARCGPWWPACWRPGHRPCWC